MSFAIRSGAAIRRPGRAAGRALRAAAWVGLRYVTIGHSVSLVWPPAGIAFAALVLLGNRYWPGVALGAFLANAATPIPLAAALAIAAGNTIEGLLAASLLRRVAGSRPQLEEPRQTRALILLAAPAGALAAALIGVTALLITRRARSARRPAGAARSGGPATCSACWSSRRSASAGRPGPRIRDTRRLLEVVALVVGTAAAADLGLLQSVQLPLPGAGGVHLPPLPLRGLGGGSVRPPRRVAGHARRRRRWRCGTRPAAADPFLVRSGGGTLFAFACYLLVLAVTGLVVASAVWSMRDRATRALQRSEERLRLALDSARMGIWYWSVESNALVWDDNLRALYGLGPGDVVAELRAVHEPGASRRPAVRGPVGGARAREGRGARLRVPDPAARRPGALDRGSGHGSGATPEGRPRYLTGVCMDVTERRSSEERLRQSHRMESVGRLAGGVAHETNNQMSVVLGAAAFILGRSDVPEAVRADVEHIRKAAERTSSVTAQLLAFSRRQILRPVVLELSALVKSWETVLRRVMGEDCTVLLRPGEAWLPSGPTPGSSSRCC